MKFDMDYIAHHNRLTLMNSYYKIAIAMGLMIITLILNNLYFDVIRENVKNKEIKRLEEKLVKEIDPLEQAKLADMIRKLRIGESNNGWRNKNNGWEKK